MGIGILPNGLIAEMKIDVHANVQMMLICVYMALRHSV